VKIALLLKSDAIVRLAGEGNAIARAGDRGQTLGLGCQQSGTVTCDQFHVFLYPPEFMKAVAATWARTRDFNQVMDERKRCFDNLMIKFEWKYTPYIHMIDSSGSSFTGFTVGENESRRAAWLQVLFYEIGRLANNSLPSLFPLPSDAALSVATGAAGVFPDGWIPVVVSNGPAITPGHATIGV